MNTPETVLGWDAFREELLKQLSQGFGSTISKFALEYDKGITPNADERRYAFLERVVNDAKFVSQGLGRIDDLSKTKRVTEAECFTRAKNVLEGAHRLLNRVFETYPEHSKDGKNLEQECQQILDTIQSCRALAQSQCDLLVAASTRGAARA